jgi:hypothetical protein
MHSTRSFIVLSIAALVGGCAVRSTELVNTWKDPATPGPLQFSKVLTVVFERDIALRRSTEDHLASRIPNATPSYTIIPEDKLDDMEWVKAKVRESGFDGAVVLRFVGQEKSTVYVPGTGGRTFYDYWGGGWGTVYEPGYLREQTTVTAETAVFDVRNDKLVWAARSQTKDPKSVNAIVDGIIEVSMDQLRKERLIAEM